MEETRITQTNKCGSKPQNCSPSRKMEETWSTQTNKRGPKPQNGSPSRSDRSNWKTKAPLQNNKGPAHRPNPKFQGQANPSPKMRDISDEKLIAESVFGIDFNSVENAIIESGKLCKDQASTMSVWIATIKKVKTPAHLLILAALPKPGCVKTGAKQHESLLFNLAWREKELTMDVFHGIITILHEKGLSAEHESDRKETPLDSLFAWFARQSFDEFMKTNQLMTCFDNMKGEEKGKLRREFENTVLACYKQKYLLLKQCNFSQCTQFLTSKNRVNIKDLLKNHEASDEMLEILRARYKIMSSIESEQIQIKTKMIINKVTDKVNDDHIWGMRHALVQGYSTCLGVLANYLVQRKVPKSCLEVDKNVKVYLDFLFNVFCDGDKGFKNLQVNAEPLILFFKWNDITIPSKEKLFAELFEKCNQIAFASVSENRFLDLESLGIIVGSFMDLDLLEEKTYEGFVLECFRMQEEETGIKMAIRTVLHAHKRTDDIVKAFQMCKPTNTALKFTIKDLLDSFGDYKVEPKKVMPVQKFNIDKVKFFTKLANDPNEIADSLAKFQNILENHPDHRDAVIVKILTCLLENATKTTDIEKIVTQIIVLITKAEIQGKYEEIDEIIKFDMPCARDNWKRVQQCCL